MIFQTEKNFFQQERPQPGFGGATFVDEEGVRRYGLIMRTYSDSEGPLNVGGFFKVAGSKGGFSPYARLSGGNEEYHLRFYYRGDYNHDGLDKRFLLGYTQFGTDFSKKLPVSAGFDVVLSLSGIGGSTRAESIGHGLRTSGYLGTQARIDARQTLGRLAFFQSVMSNWLYQDGALESREIGAALGAKAAISKSVMAKAYAELKIAELKDPFYFFAGRAGRFFGEANVEWKAAENRMNIRASILHGRLDSGLQGSETSLRAEYGRGVLTFFCEGKMGPNYDQIKTGVGIEKNTYALSVGITRNFYSGISIPNNTGLFLSFSLGLGHAKAPEERQFEPSGGIYPKRVKPGRLPDPEDAAKAGRDPYEMAKWVAKNYEYDLAAQGGPDYAARLLKSGKGVCRHFAELEAWLAQKLGWKSWRLSYFPEKGDGHAICLIENKKGELFALDYGNVQKIVVKKNATPQEKAIAALEQGNYALDVRGEKKAQFRLHEPGADPYAPSYKDVLAAEYEGEIGRGPDAKEMTGIRLKIDPFEENAFLSEYGRFPLWQDGKKKRK